MDVATTVGNGGTRPAFFYGTAVCAQLEALRAGETTPALDDPGRPHARTVGDRVTG